MPHFRQSNYRGSQPLSACGGEAVLHIRCEKMGVAALHPKHREGKRSPEMGYVPFLYLPKTRRGGQSAAPVVIHTQRT